MPSITVDRIAPAAVPSTSAHVQTAPRNMPQRPPMGMGHLEVLRIEKRPKETVPSPAQLAGEHPVRTLLSAETQPASSRSTIRRIEFAFLEGDVDPPPANADRASGRLRIYYPMQELDRVLTVLRSGKQRLCYCWLSSDRSRSVAMLMTTN